MGQGLMGETKSLWLFHGNDEYSIAYCAMQYNCRRARSDMCIRQVAYCVPQYEKTPRSGALAFALCATRQSPAWGPCPGCGRNGPRRGPIPKRGGRLEETKGPPLSRAAYRRPYPVIKPPGTKPDEGRSRYRATACNGTKKRLSVALAHLAVRRRSLRLDTGPLGLRWSGCHTGRPRRERGGPKRTTTRAAA